MLKTYRVELPSGSAERIEADLVQLRDGCLIFSKIPPRAEFREDDLRVCKAFAPGAWKIVEEVGH